MKCQNSKNGMRKRDSNLFFPFIYAIAGFGYTALMGLLNFFVNPKGIPWVNLVLVLPMILFSVFTMYMYRKNIKDVKPKDIYLPPILFSALYLIGSYGFILISPDIFLSKTYWSLFYLYTMTALCIVILTVIPKIPRKRFIILSYLGVLILAFFAVGGAVSICFSESEIELGGILGILLKIKE